MVPGGFTPALTFAALLDDGRSVFVKLAQDSAEAPAASWLRKEHQVYADVDGPFMAPLVAWNDDGDLPMLVLADLGETFGGPWDLARTAAVARMLGELRSVGVPAWLEPLEHVQPRLAGGWQRVQSDPAPFLGLGDVSAAWLEASLPLLQAAASEATLAGSALVHGDVRGGNISVSGDGRAVLVDWNRAAVGNPLFDEVAWLVSVAADGGTPPWELLPESEGMAALWCGFLAAEAALPPIPGSPRIREHLRRQLPVALAWSAHELGLPWPPGAHPR